MNANVFSKLMSKYFKYREVEGLIIYHDDDYSTVVTGFPHAQEYKIPLLKIKNPSNIPFSYNSLQEILTDELETFQKYVSTDYNKSQLANLIEFDDFRQGDFYYPVNLGSKLKKCLNTGLIQIYFRNFNKVFTINAEYVVDSDFDMYFNDFESFTIDITLKVENITVKNLTTDKIDVIEDKDKIESLIYEFNSNQPEIFEEPIWDCVTKYFRPYKTFLNEEWQYVNVNVIVK